MVPLDAISLILSLPHSSPGPTVLRGVPPLMLKTVTNVLGGRTCVGLNHGFRNRSTMAKDSTVLPFVISL